MTSLYKSLFSNSSSLWIASKPRGWINRSQVNIKNMDLAAIFHPRELSRDSRDRFNLKIGSKFIFVFIALIGFFFSGCSRGAEKPKPQAPHVTTAMIEQGDVPVYISAIGQVIPTVTVNIRPQANGKLIKAHVQQGEIVEENTLLYEIDPRPYQAILDEAQAQLAHDQALLDYAEQTVARYKQVLDDDFISKLTYEQYMSNASAARAQVELDLAAIRAAQINLDFCKITAPVAGKVSYYNVDVGNILIIDDPNQITVIRPFSPIDIEFSLPQQQFELIRKEQGDSGKWQFIATLEDVSNRSFEGITYFIDNQINQNTGTILLKGRLPNESRELWPGQFIRIKVLHKIAKKALIVPPGSVLTGKDGPYIYTVDKEGKAALQVVTVLTKTEKYSAIESDQLHAGDVVIVDGQINVAPGLSVNPVEIKK